MFLDSGTGGMKLNEKEQERAIRAWIGIDWADEKHDVNVYDVASGKRGAGVPTNAGSVTGMAGRIANKVRRREGCGGIGARTRRIIERAAGM